MQEMGSSASGEARGSECSKERYAYPELHPCLGGEHRSREGDSGTAGVLGKDSSLQS